jgi:hypothetical protein
MFPLRVLALIREFSKPLTNPLWRRGALHAILFKQSPAMRSVIRQIKQYLQCVIVQNIRIHIDIINRTFPDIFEYTNTDYIQKYGEEILLFSTSGVYDEINFYYYAKQYMISTYQLKLIKYDVHGKSYEAYILDEENGLM